MEKTYFTLNMNLEHLDEKLERFLCLRNELVMLAAEIGAEVKEDMLELKKK